MNGFEKRKELKKQKILKAAFTLFSTYGFQKVSIQEIAHQANVSQVTIYNYFGSKDDLLLESVRSFALKRLEETKNLLDDPKQTFEEKITYLILPNSTFSNSFDLDSLKALISNHPLLEEFINDINENYLESLMVELIEEGKKQGYITPSLSNQSLLFYIKMYAENIQRHPKLLQTKEQSEQITKEILHLFFYGLNGQSK